MEIHNKLSVEEVTDCIKQAMRAITNDKSAMPDVSAESKIKRNSVEIDNKLYQMDIAIRNNNLKWNIATEWIITSHRKIIGRFIVFGKRLVRKFLRWYINPLIDQQREFNSNVSKSINILGDVAHLYKNYYGLETRLQNIENSLREFHENDALINEKLYDLCKTIIYFFAESNPDLSLAIAVELFRTTSNNELSELINQLNAKIISRELNP